MPLSPLHKGTIVSAPSPSLFEVLRVTCLCVVLGIINDVHWPSFAFVQAYVAEVIHYSYVSIGLHLACRYVGLPRSHFLSSLHQSPCTIQSGSSFLYNTIWQFFLVQYQSRSHTYYDTQYWGVTIPIYLVSSTTDSIKQRIALFKDVTIPTSDPKSEFLCQSSLIVQNLQTPWITSYAWDISHALIHHVSSLCSEP